MGHPHESRRDGEIVESCSGHRNRKPFYIGRRLPLDLGSADCTAVVLCRVVLVLALDEDKCKIY